MWTCVCEDIVCVCISGVCVYVWYSDQSYLGGDEARGKKVFSLECVINNIPNGSGEEPEGTKELPYIQKLREHILRRTRFKEGTKGLALFHF